jgi:predicted membrane protein
MTDFKNKENSALTRVSSQAFIGLIVVVVGVLLLLNTTNIVDTSGLFRFVPSLFILLGLWQLVSNEMRSWAGPVTLIVVASLVQLAVLDVFDFNIFGLIWPLVLIGVGLQIVLNRRGTARDDGDSIDRFSVFALFGGANQLITSANFRGGEVTALFGGAEIDLTNAQVIDRPAVINVFTMFGGIGIKASPDMLIRTDVVAILGGTGDERRQRKALTGEVPEVIVKGFAMFGGVGIEEGK